jgi:MFS family permease
MNQLKLLKSKRFAPLFWTQFLGAFNDNCLKNALVVLITFDASTVTGIPAAQMDKYDKARVVRAVKLAEIAIMAVAAAGFLAHRYEILLFALFLMGLHSTFFGPVKYSILPQHLHPGELLSGNALVEAGTFLAILLGTICGGLLVSSGSAPLVSGGLMFFACLGYATSRQVPPAQAADPAIRVQWNPIRPTLEIFQFARRDRDVGASIVAISWFWFFGAAMLSLLPPYCHDFMRADAGTETLFLTIFSVGIGAGSMACGNLSRGRLKPALVPLGAAGMTLFTIDLALRNASSVAEASGLPSISALSVLGSTEGLRIVFDLFFLSAAGGIFIVPVYTLLQEKCDPSHRSRLIAANNVLNALFMVAAAISLMVMMRIGLGIPQIFLALAALNAAFTGWLIDKHRIGLQR